MRSPIPPRSMRRPPASRGEHATRAGGREGAVYTARRGVRQPKCGLTRAGAADMNGAMLLRAPRLLQASVAAGVIAAVASLPPGMLANMGALHPPPRPPT